MIPAIAFACAVALAFCLGVFLGHRYGVLRAVRYLQRHWRVLRNREPCPNWLKLSLNAIG